MENQESDEDFDDVIERLSATISDLSDTVDQLRAALVTMAKHRLQLARLASPVPVIYSLPEIIEIRKLRDEVLEKGMLGEPGQKE